MQSELPQTRSVRPYGVFADFRPSNDDQIKAKSPVPVLDWPNDLFFKFAIQAEVGTDYLQA
jgi:hypothetical protein